MTSERGTHGGDRPSAGVHSELSGSVSGPVVQGRDIDVHVHPPAESARPRPSELLPDPAHFTDRTAELNELDRLLDADFPGHAPIITVLGGTAGVGKTALALHWLHQMRDRFPDGMLYIDLRGFSGAEPMPPGDALGRFLRALGVAPDRVPAELDERSALFRSLTSGRRIALLADNAASAAQARALLPGTGRNLILVTSRRAIRGLTADGARFVDLDPLDAHAAVTLLTRLLGAERTDSEPDAAQLLAELCGHLPLALCASAARLAARRRWRIARMVTELTDERRRITLLGENEEIAVRTVFDLSYAALTGEQAGLYRCLGLHPGPDFDLGAASALAGLAPDRCERLLEDLVDASLVEELGTDRYRLHDLVRLHARETAQRVDGPRRNQATHRLVDWYLTAAAAADLVVLPGRWRLGACFTTVRAHEPAFGTPDAALDWLEAELPNLLAVQTLATEQDHDTATWQFCEALWGLFLYRKNYPAWLAAHDRGLAAARRCGDRPATARILVQLGFAHLQLGRLDRAEESFTEALGCDRAVRHRVGEATALEQLGLVALARGRPDTATARFAEARDLQEAFGSSRGVALMTRRLGEAHRDAGRHRQAVDNLDEARRRFADLGDRYNTARTLTDLAQTRLLTGSPAQAVELLDGALHALREQGARFEQGHVHTLLADSLERLGRPAPARDHLEQALALFQQIDAPQRHEIRARLAGPRDGTS